MPHVGVQALLLMISSSSGRPGTCIMAQVELRLVGDAGGIAQIEGLSLQQDMTAIYKTLGSCPQENLLWGSLTGREHLLYYARLRGLRVRS